MSFSVLDAQTHQTEAYINESATELVLSRRRRVPDGAGGLLVDGEQQLEPQRVRIVPGRKSLGFTVGYTIIGMPGLDVELGDTFMVGPEVIEVGTIIRKPAWRVVAEGILRAR